MKDRIKKQRIVLFCFAGINAVERKCLTFSGKCNVRKKQKTHDCRPQTRDLSLSREFSSGSQRFKCIRVWHQ